MKENRPIWLQMSSELPLLLKTCRLIMSSKGLKCKTHTHVMVGCKYSMDSSSSCIVSNTLNWLAGEVSIGYAQAESSANNNNNNNRFVPCCHMQLTSLSRTALLVLLVEHPGFGNGKATSNFWEPNL